MAEVPSYVLDATVGSKWHLDDEAHIDLAQQIRQDFAQDLIRLIAPDLLRHEAAASILKATRNPQRPRRLDPTDAEQALGNFLSRPILYIDAAPLVPTAFRLARRFNCSYYDGVYLALAGATGTRLLHADQKLRRALARSPLAIWIEDYR